MRDFDFSPLFRSAIGFDRLPSLLDTAMRTAGSADSYPPYNIEKTGEDAYRISIAVAGFAREDLEIEVRDGVLYVKGKNAAEPEGVTYLHRGIAGRAFERRFQLAEHVRPEAADLVNGLLTIDLVRELPEAKKPRQIEIKSGAIEHQKAA
jgi:molecular chaperone IbpA